MTTTRSLTSRTTIFGGAVLLGTWAILLVLLCFTPLRSFLPAAIGMRIESLGQFGDAFAPVTAFFALIAAVGAWRSYEAQQEQLNDERKRNHTQRFDDLFFRLLDYYGSAIDSVVDRTVFPSGAWERTELKERLLGAREMVEDLCKFDEFAAKGEPNAFTRWFEHIHADSRFKVLAPLAAQIPAMLSWLQRERITDVEPYGKLLCARLSDAEIWFWQHAIAAEAPHLIDFAQEMQVFGEGGGPPKYIGTGRGMTTELAANFISSGVDRYVR